MYIRYSGKYGKSIKIIYPGEFHVSGSNEFIGTLLGSCVAVCLFDREKGISGMNHIMLPGRITKADVFSDRTSKYGITAINQLVSSMKSMGASKSKMEAKIFGGGHVLAGEKSMNTIPSDNVRLAMLMMELEDIPVVQSDVGGQYTRKVLFDVQTGNVYLKRTAKGDALNINDVTDEVFEKEIMNE